MSGMYTLMKLQGYGTVILPCLLLQEQSTSALGGCFYVTALDHLIGRSNHRSVYCGLHPNVRRRCRLSASILRNPTLEATGSPKIITLSQLSFRTFTTVGYLQRYVQLVLVLEMSLIICSALHRLSPQTVRSPVDLATAQRGRSNHAHSEYALLEKTSLPTKHIASSKITQFYNHHHEQCCHSSNRCGICTVPHKTSPEDQQ